MNIPSKKILLTIAPIFWPKLPPLGVAYLQAYASKEGFPVDILDLNNIFYNLAEPQVKKAWLMSCNTAFEENILKLIRENHPQEYEEAIEKMLTYDIIGFSCFKSNFKASLEIVKILKSKKKEIRALLGGPEIARQFFKRQGKLDEGLTHLIDFLVVGEGELSFLDYLKNGVRAGGIAEFSELKSLESSPFPRYEGINLSSYPKDKSISLLFSRGCVRQCSFCSERLLYHSFRTRCIEDIIEELRFHKEKNGIEYFIFHDSMMNADLKKLQGFCDAVIEHFGSIRWEAQIAVRNDMEPSLFEKMKKSGCYNLFIGLESGSDRMLKKMNKGFTLEEALGFFRKLKHANLNFGVSLIVGYPGERQDDFQESLDFILRHKDLIAKIEQINPFVYYDGTGVKKSEDVPSRERMSRMNIFMDSFRKHGIKHTNAFVGNLLDK